MKYILKSVGGCRVNHKWICRLYAQGFGIAEIVRQTGYNKNTIKSHIIAEGIYSPGRNKINKEIDKNELKIPSDVISDYKNNFDNCQVNPEKNILVVAEEEKEAREEEQEVIEADSITRYKDENNLSFETSIDQKHIAEIDKVINYVLKLLKDKDRLKRSKTSVLNTIFATMVEKKKMLQGLDPKGRGADQVIVNFFMNREFAKEIERMKALKDKSM